MSVAKVVEICAASPKSIEDAVLKGVERASETLERVEGVWVQDIKAEIENGRTANGASISRLRSC